MQKNISNILNEWFYRLPNGYATQPYDDSELEVLKTNTTGALIYGAPIMLPLVEILLEHDHNHHT